MANYEVKLAGATVVPQAFTVRDIHREPSEFGVTLPERDASIDLAASAEFYRKDALQLTGVVEKISESYGPDEGYEMVATGIDKFHNLNRRMVERELFVNVKPADAIKYLNRPSKRIGSYLCSYFKHEEEMARFAYGTKSFIHYESDPTYYVRWDWLWLYDTYTSSIYTYRPTAPDYDFSFMNTDDSRTYSFDNYNVEFILYGHFSYLSYPFGGHTNGGIILKYKDANNWLRIYISTVEYSGWWQASYLVVEQNVEGATSILVNQLLSSGIPAADLYAYSLGIQALGTALKIHVVSTWYGPCDITIDTTFDSSLLGEGRVGLYSELMSTSGGIGVNYCWYYFKIYNTPIVSTSLNSTTLDIFHLTDIDERSFWESGANQAIGQWVKMDLSEAKAISAFKVIQDIAKYARNYKIQRSANNVDWTDVAVVTDSDTPTMFHVFTPISARYWRIYITAAAPYHWQIQEIYVREADDGLPLVEENTIDSYGELVTFRTDLITRKQAMQKLADAIGWNLYLTKTGKLMFKETKGIDRSGTVKFETGVNILSIEREQDLLDPWVAGVYNLSGQGMGRQLIPLTDTFIPTVEIPPAIQNIEKNQDLPDNVGFSEGGGMNLHGEEYYREINARLRALGHWVEYA